MEDLLGSNKKIANEIREKLTKMGILTINLMSSPGSGKTTLLESLAEYLSPGYKMAVIEGDIETERDAERIRNKGIPAWQITTGGACHLEAKMVGKLFNQIPSDLDFLFIENVGNLVCPAEFDVGEAMKVMILSIPEGDDKPFKYPLMFQECKALVINKIDLLPYVDCSVEKIRDATYKLNPKLDIFEVSCRTGEGLDEWCAWLVGKVKA